MNYLKNISNIKHLSDLAIEEEAYFKTRSEAADMIRKIARMLYDAEMNADVYNLWEAIENIANAIYYKID